MPIMIMLIASFSTGLRYAHAEDNIPADSTLGEGAQPAQYSAFLLRDEGPQTSPFPSPEDPVAGIWASVTSYVSGAVLYFEVEGTAYSFDVSPNSNTMLTFASPLIVSNVRVTIEDRGYPDDQIVVAYPDTPICFTSSPGESSTFSDEIPEGASIVYSSPPESQYCSGYFDSSGLQTAEFSDPLGRIRGIWASVTTEVQGAVLLFDSDGATYSMNIMPNVYSSVLFSVSLDVENVKIIVADANPNEGAGIGYLYDGSSETEAPEKVPSEIEFSINPSVVILGENVTILGTISPAHEADVTLKYDGPDSSVRRTILSSPEGNFEDIFVPSTTGTWNVSAGWDGDSDHIWASSSSMLFEVDGGEDGTDQQNENEQSQPPEEQNEPSAPATEPVQNPAAEQKPDLIPSQIYLEPGTRPIGKKEDVVCKVENWGVKNSGEFYVNFYVDGNYLRTVGPKSVPISGQTLAKAEGAWIKAEGVHSFTCVADSSSVVDESSEENNSIEIAIGSGPSVPPVTSYSIDLHISRAYWSPSYPTVGDLVTFTYTESNQGRSAAQSHSVSLVIDGQTVRTAEDSVAGGSSKAGTFASWKCTDGVHAVMIVADPANVISESDEDNNVWSGSISCANVVISPIPAPQLPPISLPQISTSQLKADIWSYNARSLQEFIILFSEPENSSSQLIYQLNADGTKFMNDAIKTGIDAGEVDQVKYMLEALKYSYDFYASSRVNYEIAMSQLRDDSSLTSLVDSLTDLKDTSEAISEAYEKDDMTLAQQHESTVPAKVKAVSERMDAFISKVSGLGSTYTRIETWSLSDVNLGERKEKSIMLEKSQLGGLRIEIKQNPKPFVFILGYPNYYAGLSQKGAADLGAGCSLSMEGRDDGSAGWAPCPNVLRGQQATLYVQAVDLGYTWLPFISARIESADLEITAKLTYNWLDVEKQLLNSKFKEIQSKLSLALTSF